jgi:UDP-glucose-4-epimerase GalE
MVQKILVIGGAGYIGSHVCKELYKAGFLPVCYDSLVTGHKDAVKWGPFELGDIDSKERLFEVIKEYNPRVVIHLAAHTYIQESINQPSKYYTNNFQKSLILLEAMQLCGLHKIIYTSTASVYGAPGKIPIMEGIHPRPINPYGISKLMVEKTLQDSNQSYGLNYVTFRCFNVAGVDPDQELWEKHTPEIHLIPQIIDALSNNKEFIVFGDSCLTPDGTCIRDYVHVTDVARAYVKAVNFILEEPEAHLTLNIGSGIGYSVLDIVNIAMDVTGKNLRHSIRPARDGDPSEIISDIIHAKQILDWEPEFNITKNLFRFLMTVTLTILFREF